MKKLSDWILNRFSYIQIYVFICFLFLISLLPIGYYWVKTHLEQIHLINTQLEGLKEEFILKNLLEEIQQYRLISQRYFAGKKQSLVEMNIIENQIRQSLHQGNELNILKKDTNVSQESSLWQEINPLDIETKWNEFKHQFPQLSARESESRQTILIHDMIIQLTFLAERIGISYFAQIDKYVMVESISLRLINLQEYLSQLILICEKILIHQKKDLSRDRAILLTNLIGSDLDYLKHIIKLYHSLSIDEEQMHVLKLLRLYQENIENLLLTIKTHILDTPDLTVSLSTFQEESQSVLTTGYQLWDLGLTTLTEIFHTEKNYIIARLWLVLLTTLLLTSCAFFLGLSLIYTGIVRISQLTAATDSFTNGNLSVRVPDIYQDEIGHQAQAFNRMAQKLQEIVNHLYELLEATSSLSQGDLAARIQVRQNDTEFDRVALSFNKMAETFETIIRRLQYIGRMLTTSASEIASASKEQETIVIEQEATIREIAFAANEISSTAKEFANTMNDVNQTAEETSDLALRGKDSLNNMESIMRNMVKASTNIAAKLAVLNERASNITSVITTITKVADQTNLLSLNASIEAEKAGEYGRSFAVIAREIRRLADQTAIATLDIEKMVNEIMTAISSSVMSVHDFTQEIQNGVEQVRTVSEQLATIIERVQAFTARFELINQGMQAQSTGAEQINEAIAQLSQTARQTSEAIHQFHKTVEELNQAANELSILNPFKSQGVEQSSSISTEKISTQSTVKETMPKFNKTISKLNVAASKLKSLNTQLGPPFPKKDEDLSSS